MQFRLVTDKVNLHFTKHYSLYGFIQPFFLFQEGSKVWNRSISTRAHTHDIRALAMIEREDQSLLVSGG